MRLTKSSVYFGIVAFTLTGTLTGVARAQDVVDEDSTPSKIKILSTDETAKTQVEQNVQKQQAGTSANLPAASTSVAEENVRQPLTLKNEIFALRPNAGAIVYHDVTNSTTSRALYGVTADYNFTAMFTDNPAIYFGLSTGGLFSHLGSATSTFFGANPTSVVNSPSANIVVIPADIKAGVNMGNAMRLAVHGGGNVLYRTQGTSMNVGPATATSSPIWRVYPDVGGDVDFELTRGVTAGLRPDYTFTPGNNLFMGTVELGISLG